MADEYGTAFLLTFPFWIFVSLQDAPAFREFHFEGVKVRVYPPFRSGPANFLPAPHVKLEAVPQLVQLGRPILVLQGLPPTLAMIPKFGIDAHGKMAALACFGPEFKEGELDPFPMDSLRVDVLKAKPDPVLNDVVARLLDMSRWRATQWWIRRSIDPLAGYVRNAIDLDQTGAFQSPIRPYGGVHTVVGDEVPITDQLWGDCISRVARGELASQPVLRTLDALHSAACREYERAVIEAAIGVEQAKDNAFRRLWPRVRTGAYRRGKVLTGSDVHEHITRVLEGYIGRNYATEHPENAAIINQLWFARGNVAHGSGAYYRSDGAMQPVDQPTAKRFAMVARHCVNWLLSL